jgi:phosphoenolpyruvate carboxykinase (GTP)
LDGDVDAIETPIGRLPKIEDLNLDGLDISDETITELFKVDAASWTAEADLTQEYFEQFGEHTPKELFAQLDGLKQRLS